MIKSKSLVAMIRMIAVFLGGDGGRRRAAGFQSIVRGAAPIPQPRLEMFIEALRRNCHDGRQPLRFRPIIEDHAKLAPEREVVVFLLCCWRVWRAARFRRLI